MATQYTSYWLYQKYETRGSQAPIPAYPNVWSVDGDGTMPKVIKTENDTACGYVPPDTRQWRWTNIPISQDFVCDICPQVEPQQRTTYGEPYCTGYDMYADAYSQVSYDDGYSWITTATTPTLFEIDSLDCGYPAKFIATYTGGQSYSVKCNSSTELTTSDTKPTGYTASAMTSANIGDCVTSIGEQAFFDCTSLSSVTIPNSITSIGDYAFLRCGLTSVTIPDTVTSIGVAVFYGCKNLSSVTIPNSVTSLGGSAFEGCSGLTSVTISSGVTSIDALTFARCSSLSSVTIPSGVTNIGAQTFTDCSGLTSIIVEATTPPAVGYRAFYNTNDCPIFVPCESMDAFKTAENWEQYADRITSKIFVATYKNDNTYTVAYHGTNVLTRSDVTGASREMTSAIIGDCINYIDEYAFGGNLTGHTGRYDSLTSITIPDSVVSIYRGAFCYCRKLASITVPNSVVSIGASAFYACSSLTEVTLSSRITEIPVDLFSNCSSLTSIDIPSGVTSIGKYAFQFCTSLSDVVIPSGVTTIGYGAFAGCESLSSITCLATTPPAIERYAFHNTRDCLIFVPYDSVTAYKNAWSEYPDRIFAIPPCDAKFQATYTTHEAYYVCCDGNSYLTASETKINYPLPSSMASANIGNCVVHIGDEAFGSDSELYACTKLTTFTIPSSVTTIGNRAFRNCYSLTGITIPDSVTSIGNYAFTYCTGLTSVTIGSSVTTIGESAFAYCTSLTSITINATTPPSLGTSAFDNTNNCTIYVPDECVYVYREASGWSSYANRIYPISYYPFS